MSPFNLALLVGYLVFFVVAVIAVHFDRPRTAPRAPAPPSCGEKQARYVVQRAARRKEVGRVYK